MLDAKKIREIVVLGRRGPAQAAFTNPEIKELGEMEDADVIVDPAEVELDPASEAYLDSDEADKTTRVNVETLREFSQRTPEGKRQRIVLRFLASPVEIKGDGKVEKIVIGRNELVEEGGTLRAKDTGEREELECGLVLRSVGYTGVPIEGVPFDEKRGLILNEGGRVLDSHDSGHKVGHYTAGWIKRGPSGVIGTNKKDALETVRHLLADVGSPDPARPGATRAGGGRGAARRARRPLRQLRGLAGDRPGRGRPRRAARPARASSSSASRRCSARSAKKSANPRADKKLHFRAPHARPISLPCGAWSRCDPPGPIHAWTISPSTPISASMRSTGDLTRSMSALTRSTRTFVDCEARSSGCGATSARSTARLSRSEAA